MTRPKNSKPQFRAAVKPDGTLEMMVYGEIVDAETISMLESWGYSTDGFVSAITVKKALDETGYSQIRVRINSPGGDAFEGVAIHALLASQAKPVETCVDGIAASAASIIAMAGSTRKMGRSAMLMIHDAWTYTSGNSRELQKMADTLDKIDGSIAEAYVARTKKSAEEVRALMDAETWLSAQECVDQGFATAIMEQPEEEASAAMAQARKFKTLAKLKHVPEKLKAAAPECECACQGCMDGDCENCTMDDCEDAVCKDNGCPMQDEAAQARAAAEIPPPAVEPPPAAEPESNLSLFRALQWQAEKGIHAA